jgi:hypothetical protein
MDSLPPIPPGPATLEPEPPYYGVSLLKLGVMSFMTAGLYELYWMYKNWKLIQKRETQKMLPFWRAFFAVIFVYSLLNRIRASQDEAGQEKLPAGALAITWIVITLSYKLPDPFWLVSLFSFIPLLVVQSHVNKLNALTAPNYPINSRFTLVNWVWIVIASILIILAIIGSLLPNQ